MFCIDLLLHLQELCSQLHSIGREIDAVRLLAFGSRGIGFDGDMLFYQPPILKGKGVFRFKSKLFSKIQLVMFNTKVVLI